MNSDTSEKGLELLILHSLTGLTDEQILQNPAAGIAELPTGYAGAGYLLGSSQDYDRDHAVDLRHLLAFIEKTQPKACEQLGIAREGPRRVQFLSRLQGEIAKRGIVDVLRKSVLHGPARIYLFYGTPSAGNQKAQELWESNLFSITRLVADVVTGQLDVRGIEFPDLNEKAQYYGEEELDNEEMEEEGEDEALEESL